MASAATTMDPTKGIDIDAFRNDVKKAIKKVEQILQKIEVSLSYVGLLKGKRQKEIAKQQGSILRTDTSAVIPAVTQKEAVSDEDLRRLERDIRRKKFLTGVKKRFIFDEETFDKSLKDRETAIIERYANQGILGVANELLTPKKIRSTLGLSGLGTSAKKHIKQAIVKWVADTKKDVRTSKFSNEIRYRKSVLKEKTKEKKNNIMATALVMKIREAITDRVEEIKGFIADAKQAIVTKASSTKAGQKLLNAPTAIKQSRLMTKMSATGKKIPLAVTKITTGVGKAVTVVGEVGKGIALTAKMAYRGGLYGGVAYLAFGGSAPVAFTVGGTVAVITAGHSLLTTPRLSSIGFINRFQTRFGYGQYKNTDGSWNISKVQAAGKKPITGWGRTFKSANATSKYGVIGSAIGSVIALATGAPMALGATIGMGIGALGGFAGDWLNTRILNKGLLDPKLPKLLGLAAQFPSVEFGNRLFMKFWIASQIDLILKKYKGNIGLYLTENFGSGQPGNSSLENILLVGTNWLSLTLGMKDFILPRTLVRVGINTAIRVFPKLTRNLRFIRMFKTTPAALGWAVGETVGTLAGIATLSLLGLPIGTGAIIGGMVGGFLGFGVGLLIAGMSAGIGSWAVFLISSAGSAIGSYLGTLLGGLFDKSVESLTSMVNTIFGGISAIFAMLTLLRTKLNFDNLIVIIMALLALFQAFDRMGVFESAYQCVDAEYCPNPDMQPGYGIYYLDNYNIAFINGTPLTQIENTTLIQYLNNNSDKLTSKFPDKKVVLNLVNDESYDTFNMAIIGLDRSHLTNIDTIDDHLNSRLLMWENLSVNKDMDLSFNFN